MFIPHLYRPDSMCVHTLSQNCNYLHIHATELHYASSNYTLLWTTDYLVAFAGPPDRNTPSEEKMVEVYQTEAHRLNVVFSETAFNYAKAVSCLRLITIVRVSYKLVSSLNSSHARYCVTCVCVYELVCVYVYIKTILGTSIGAGCSNQMQVAQGQDLH